MDINAFLNNLLQTLNYSFHCSASPLKTAGCGQFWVVILYSAELALLLICIFAIRHILREKREWKAYQQRLVSRAKVADPDTMQREKWKSDDSFGDISESQLAEKMRQEIKRVKI